METLTEESSRSEEDIADNVIPSVSDEEDEDSVGSSPHQTTEGTSLASSGKVRDVDDWDTDLEIEDEHPNYDVSHARMYVEACRELGVVPASYFIRRMCDQTLSMHYHGLGPLGAKAIAIPLMSNTKLLSLDLEDNWLEGEGGQHIADMLKENCYIAELNLAGNRLGSVGCKAICEMLMYNSTLNKLNLSGNGFQDKDALIIAEALLDNTTLMDLDLSHNDFSDGSAPILGHAISENGDLHVLDLSWNNFRRQAAVHILDGIKTNTRLKRVNLSWNGIGNEASSALGECLRHNTVLLELDVTSNRIGAGGAALVAKGLDYNETLKVLKIGNNPLGSDGAFALLTAIYNDRSVLKEMDMASVLVSKEFEKLNEEIAQIREVKVIHGGILSNYVIKGIYKKKRRPVEDPGINLVEVLENWEAFVQCDPMGLLKVSLDTKKEQAHAALGLLDKDNEMKVTSADLKDILRELDIGLNEEHIINLFDRLDKTDQDYIDYSVFISEEEEREATIPEEEGEE